MEKIWSPLSIDSKKVGRSTHQRRYNRVVISLQLDGSARVDSSKDGEPSAKNHDERCEV
jgi:hypothetical protein